jgi:hypothetical protein
MYTTTSSGCVNIIQIAVQCGARAHDTDIIIIIIVCTWSFCAYHYYRGHTAVMHSAGFRAVSWTTKTTTTAAVAYRRSAQAARYADVLHFLQLFSRYKRGQLGGGYTVYFIPRTSRRPVREHTHIYIYIRIMRVSHSSAIARARYIYNVYSLSRASFIPSAAAVAAAE